MKNKIAVIILYIIQAIPIPISLITILGSIISISNIGMMTSTLVAVVAVVAMLLAGTYTITYVISLLITTMKKRLNIYSYMPILHGVLTVLFIYLWSYVEKLA